MTTSARVFGTASVAAGLWLLAVSGAAAQKAQYSSQDIINTFATKPTTATQPTTGAPGACEQKGMVTGDDGVCEPVKNSRGFSLPTRASVRAQGAAPASASTPAAPARRIASAPARPAAVAARVAPAAQPHRDLLITFKLGSSELTDQAKANARVFAEALKSPALGEAKFDLSGYTDSLGDKDKNQQLSQQRADAVKAFLVSQGVPDARLQANGHGASDFIKAPASPQNRRVEARRLD